MRNDQKSSPKRRLGGGLMLPASAVDNYESAVQVLAKLEGVDCTLTRLLASIGRNTPEKLAELALNGHGGEHSPPKSRHKNFRPGAISASAN